jgi:UDP-2,3-diacylglucosamine hydrolase
VDHASALAALQACGASVLLHGHTHRPAEHRMHDPASGHSALRIVLSDWDLDAQPPRAECLRLQRDAAQGWTWQRVALA